jgi:Tfp pilus assembly protein FimT
MDAGGRFVLKDYRNTGKGWYVVPDSDAHYHRLDRAAAKAQRSVPVRVVKRQVVTGAQTYIAYDAHHLLEADSEATLARPGHPLG